MGVEGIRGLSSSGGVPAVPRVAQAIPPAESAQSAGTAMSGGEQGAWDGKRSPAPSGAGYVLMQRYLVAADHMDGAHIKFPPNPVQLSLGLLTGSGTGVVMVDVDGDGISIEPPTRLDRRA